MRIVIDMQGAQSIEWEGCGIGSYTIELVKAIIREKGTHEVILVLNGAFENTIDPIRTEFKGLLNDSSIHVWHGMGGGHYIDAAEGDLAVTGNPFRRKAAEIVREGFIASLQPDVFLMTSFFEGARANTASELGAVGRDFIAAVFLPGLTPQKAHLENGDVKSWPHKKLDFLSSFDVFLIMSGSLYQDVICHLGLPERVVINIAATGATNLDFESDGFCARLERGGLEQSKKISWDKAALKAIKAFEALFEERSKVNAVPSLNSEQGLERRLRLAYISPLQPDRSGISDYSAELLPVLSRYYQIDVVVRNEWVADEWVNANCGVRSVAWFRENSQQYDRVLYHFGNSAFHDYMFDLLRDVPGVVVLHDFYLSGAAAYIENRRPYFWPRALYVSHGYKALMEYCFAGSVADIAWKYPCSLEVMQNSLGVISHSKNSLYLAQKWYGGSVPAWSIIPHLRSSGVACSMSDAKGKIGFTSSDFIVCAFGEVGPAKLNTVLLKAWLASSLSTEKACYLIFVGESHGSDYGQELEAMIRQSGCEQNIRITGWADQTLFRQYLAAADVGVQLRTLSRGETSGTILDCMNYGLATIVNANGSVAELNKDAVWMLPDDFSEDELRQALEVLFQDVETRKNLGENAREEILKKHQPEQCAKMYSHSIERFYQSSKSGLRGLMDAIAALEGAGKSDLELKKIAAALAPNYLPAFTKKQLLVDVSALADKDLGTGIQRVVKNVLWACLNHPPDGCRIEPVYAKKEGSGYRYARRFTKAFLGLGAVEIGEDDLIDYRAGDVFFALDWCPPVQTAQKAFYQKLRRQGVRTIFLLYDILCIRMPRCFPDYADAYFKGWLEVAIQADEVVGISRAVAEDLRCWLDETEALGRRLTRRPEITYSHIGADILAGSAAQPCMADFAESEQQVLQRIEGGTAFLMVATIEPRKGHAQVLDAFEQLWQSGSAAMLVVVGRQGWMVEGLIARIESHPELGRRLWWLEGIGDEYLDALYRRCACLIAASFGEGFGLPLIEAAQHKLPVIARDIPVFREVAGEHAYYFDGDTADDLAASLVEWLALYQAGEHPKSDDMPWLTWEECAAQLMDLIVGQRHKQNAPDSGVAS